MFVTVLIVFGTIYRDLILLNHFLVNNSRFQNWKYRMFVDYSGLQRFSIINEKFANKYLQILHFDAIQSPEERLRKLKEDSSGLEGVQSVRLEDFKLDWGIIDYMYKMMLCVTQMQEVSSFIKRCPTVYYVEMFGRVCPMSRYSMENLSVPLLKTYRELQEAYDRIREELLGEVKKLIVELKPDYGYADFRQWHILQKYLYYECCDALPQFLIPKTDVVIIPKTFPKLFVEQVNKNGFMKASSQVRFFMFDTLSAERSFDPIKIEDLKLKAIGDKVTTIWKENEDTEFGTDSDQTNVKDSTRKSSRLSTISKEPEFIKIFQEHDINIDNGHRSVRFEKQATVSRQKHKDDRLNLRDYFKYSNDGCENTRAERNSMDENSSTNSDVEESANDNLSSNKSNRNDIFSPLSSGKIATALTPDNGSLGGHQKNPVSFNSYSPSMFPPPPDLPPNAFGDYHIHPSKRESVKIKFREFVARPIQKCFIRHSERDSSAFGTIDSFAEFQEAPWDEVSSKKFLKFKFKKFKRDCRYYKQIAKRFFDDIHENNSPH